MRLRTGVTGWRAPEGPMLNATMPSAFSWGLAQVHQQDAAVREGGRLDPQLAGPYRPPDRGVVADSDRPALSAEPQIRAHARGRLDRSRVDPRMHDAVVLMQLGGDRHHPHHPVPRRLLEAKPQQLVERAVLVLVIEVHQRSTPRPLVKSSVPARPGSP